jgi:hypothetical protein
LFFTKPKWLNGVINVLKTKQMEESLLIGQKQRLAKKVEPSIMKNVVLYRLG